MNIDDRPHDGPPSSRRVPVYTGANQPDAGIVRGALMAAGIPAIIGERVTEAYAPNLAIAEGHWGTIAVPQELEVQARQVLAAFAEGQGRIPDDELDAAALGSFDPRV